MKVTYEGDTASFLYTIADLAKILELDYAAARERIRQKNLPKPSVLNRNRMYYSHEMFTQIIENEKIRRSFEA